MGVEPQPPPGINHLVSFDTENANGDVCASKDTSGDGTVKKNDTITCKDGSTYVGQMLNGMRHGRGLRRSVTSNYDGEWEADTQHGRGKQTWTDGRIYEGQFDQGKFSGDGRMRWSTQKGDLVYEGQYRDDLKHGFGKFVWADGRTYEGEWCCGKRHGRGKYINARLEQKVGYWLDDKFDRWEADPVPTKGDTNQVPANLDSNVAK
jgi:hypothetical protein